MPTNTPPNAERTGETGDAGSFIPVNSVVEADHGRLKAGLPPMRGLKRLRSARVISAGHAFVQCLRRGHYELDSGIDPRHQLTAILTELAHAF
jgi:transposase, IS6 family